MTRTFVLRPQALRDTQAAKRWYDEQKAGLGDRFSKAVLEAIERVRSNPEFFRRVYGEIRRAAVRDFPYGVYFRLDADQLTILSVMHGRRHPRRWQSRH